LKKALSILWIISIVLLSSCGKLFKPESTPTPTVTATAIPTRTAVPTATVTPTITPTATPQVENRLSGFNLGTHLNDSPETGTDIAEEDLRALIERISPYTHWIRTYSVQGGLENAGAIAHEFGLEFAATAWLSSNLVDNAKEMEALIELAKSGNVDLAIIGNETLLRGDLTARELQVYIDWFKSAVPNVRVTTTDVWSELEKYPGLISNLDVVAVNVYPYWDGVPVDEAVNTIENWYLEALKKVNTPSSHKEIIIAETGWPSCGENGDAASQAAFFNEFVAFAEHLDIQYFWFEAYDEPWKVQDEGEAGACWGVWDVDTQMKPGMEKTFNGVFEENTRSPKLRLTYVPPMGSTGKVEGYALNVDPDEYRVVVYIYVPDAKGWWTKPFFNQPYTYIESDGHWSTSIFTGGLDEQATKVAAYLVPKGYGAPTAAGLSSLPLDLISGSVARDEGYRF
jgi:exo-beta-1,3-glucanase (GH17 family)